MKALTLLVSAFLALTSYGQIGSTIAPSRTVNWKNAGVQYPIPESHYDYDVVVNMVDEYGLDVIGVENWAPAIEAAINAADENYRTMLFFPPGKYNIAGKIELYTAKDGTGVHNDDNIVLVGSGHNHTKFLINSPAVGGLDYITFHGDVGSTDASARAIAMDSYSGGVTHVNIASAIPDLVVGDLIEISEDPVPPADWDSEGCLNESYETHPVGQLVKVTGVSSSGTTVAFSEPLKYQLHANRNPKLKKIYAIANSGIEDIQLIVRPTAQPGRRTIKIEHAVNCWVRGSEFIGAKNTMLDIKKSAHITVSGCYLHHVFDYSGAASQYGIVLGNELSSWCLIENNIISDTRHAIVLSGSAHGNVISHNFATNSFISHDNSIGADIATSDLLLHGYYPGHTLFEGNISNRLHSDKYAGYQGAHNTFFRNKQFGAPKVLDIWGCPSPNILGNTNYSEVQITVPECYSSFGELEDCNPCAELNDHSYYATERPSFLSSQFYTWPAIGPKVSGGNSSTNSNPAEYRYTRKGQQCDYKWSPLVGYSVKNEGLFTAINSVVSNRSKLVQNQYEYSIGRYSLFAEDHDPAKVEAVTTARLAHTNGQEEVLYVFNNPGGGTAVYLSTDKAIAPGTTPVFAHPFGKITAITAGKFQGNGLDDIFIAYEDAIGKVYIYRSDDPTNLMNVLVYGSPTVYWKIDALTTGDFDNSGDDELIVGLNSNGPQAKIFNSDGMVRFEFGHLNLGRCC